MTATVGWSALLRREWLPLLVALVGGVLLHSMNVLMLATVLPSIVEDVGGTSMMSWPTTAFLASSIVAATCTGHLTARLGARTAFCAGAMVFGIGALICALAPSMGIVVTGRFVQGFGGGVLGGFKRSSQHGFCRSVPGIGQVLQRVFSSQAFCVVGR